MCRLLAHVSPAPATTKDVIGDSAAAEWQRLGRLHADGWGTAWLAGQEIRRYRDPARGVDSPDLAGALGDTPSRARLTHLRLATEGMANRVSNTHPFRVDDIALAHNGSISPFAQLRAKVSDEELARVGGNTDTAAVFALILRRVDAGEPLFDAVTSTVVELRREFPRSALNLLVLSPEELIAVHANEGAPIPHKEFEASGLGPDLPADHVDHYYRLSWRRSEDGAIAVTSSGLTGDGWHEMAPETAVRVDLATLQVERRELGARAAVAA
ncbi:class II glutamine amidotransferase [Agrococcus terreus]|uniref:class II glutamine amidotransferase n=1 Tax=Agrococcus terreus TaxID=574649 RepID=UPI00385091E5